MTNIICGTLDTIPLETTHRLIGLAREGGDRLVIVDEGDGMTAALADINEDLLIDSTRGNWDFYADHPTEMDKAHAAEAMIPSQGIEPAVFNQATCLLTEILCDFGWDYHGHLSRVSEHIRGLEYESIADHFRLDVSNEDDTARAFTIAALLNEAAGRFTARDPRVPRVSIARWLASSPAAILFINAGGDVRRGACRSVSAAISLIVRREADAGTRSHIVKCSMAAEEGVLQPPPLVSIGAPQGSC
ncbi:type IV secretion system DNA-binding domain-containing protein [Sphingomonas lacusdianchii]|uniref:type IV secretion system DNA-binding domain-containing protein n=1 Tax=Sphingomonas lacusdianchii TaxID=2917992 RepID=UPI001F5A1EF9|nr:type IV secretion system DNA-binding domain-containing protein [Sphingomonas sp. JXJ CY 53]